jgi:hypothetical protein
LLEVDRNVDGRLGEKDSRLGEKDSRLGEKDSRLGEKDRRPVNIFLITFMV